ncbi:MAG: MarC family protein, partial [Acidobacteriaceae bacterium]
MHARLLPLIVRLFDFFTIAFSALFPLLNPFGSAMLFLGLVGPADAIVYRRLARRVALYTVLFLMVVDLAGALVLTFFGISLPVIQVAGGLVLASMGWTLLNQPDAPDTAEASGTSSSLEELDSKVFYPFT